MNKMSKKSCQYFLWFGVLGFWGSGSGSGSSGFQAQNLIDIDILSPLSRTTP